MKSLTMNIYQFRLLYIISTLAKNESGVYSGDSSAQYPAAPPPYPGPPAPPAAAAPTAYPHVVQGPTVVHGTTVIHHGPTMVPTVVPAVVVGQQMGPQATNYVCKSCNHQIVTRIERSPSLRTHIFALFLCLVG